MHPWAKTVRTLRRLRSEVAGTNFLHPRKQKSQVSSAGASEKLHILCGERVQREGSLEKAHLSHRPYCSRALRRLRSEIAGTNFLHSRKQKSQVSSAGTSEKTAHPLLTQSSHYSFEKAACPQRKYHTTVQEGCRTTRGSSHSRARTGRP